MATITKRAPRTAVAGLLEQHRPLGSVLAVVLLLLVGTVFGWLVGAVLMHFARGTLETVSAGA